MEPSVDVCPVSQKTAVRVRLRLLLGVTRRVIANLLRRRYVRGSLARRQGECQRCGACCRLGWKCRYFRIEEGLPSCSVYGRIRPVNCGTFPIDARDIADRDLVMPGTPCGYSWDGPPAAKS